MGGTRYSGGYRPSRSNYLPHQGKREIERRLQQAARNTDRQAKRLHGSYWERNGHSDVVGVSRRGLPIWREA